MYACAEVHSLRLFNKIKDVTMLNTTFTACRASAFDHPPSIYLSRPLKSRDFKFILTVIRSLRNWTEYPHSVPFILYLNEIKLPSGPAVNLARQQVWWKAGSIGDGSSSNSVQANEYQMLTTRSQSPAGVLKL